ncbi:MFS family permease [Arthrobacter silviterrae]|uniref:MFS transporter n=1 Tax=Arthrobacter silviterrae TaxID=2026658 RepID=A0ABX0DDD5_9MICC|nr:MFS transporter [Arthrobacter silviterrae]MDQ0278064.1 MFS family permease [Arthrobacter silviterrae]NGN84944.1 MFS transporter [Arthrobacter silviterrae]
MSSPASIWGPQYRSATAGFFGLAFMVAYSSAAITTAMPRAANELNGLPLYGLAFGITMAASVVSMTLAAIWTDRSGPQTPLLAGVGIYVLGMVLAAAAPTMELLVAARALQGFGSGLDGVALYVGIARVFPVHLRPRMFAALAAAWLLPSIVGPALSGVVTDHFGWRWVFATVPVLALGAAAIIYRGTKGSGINDAPARADGLAGDPGSRQARSPGTGRSPGSGRSPGTGRSLAVWRAPAWAVVASVSVLLLGDASARTRGWWPAELGAAVVLLCMAVSKLLPRGTWRMVRGLPSLILMRGLMGTAFTIADVYLPLYMIDQRHLPAWLAGLSLSVGGVTWAVGAWLAGRGRWKPATSLQWGSLSMLAGMAVSSLVLVPGWPVWIAWVGWIAAGFGIGLAYPTQSVLVLERSAVHEQGANSSALQLSETLTTAAALGVVGAVFAALLLMGTASYVMAFGVAVLLALATLLVSRRAA